MATTSVFHPYKVISQGQTSLQLEAGSHSKILVWVFRAVPFITFAMGIAAYLLAREIVVLLSLTAIALLEAIALSFVKSPSSVSMDSMGFTLDTISSKGVKQTWYLSNDIDYIQYRSVRAKHANLLVYDAILKTGKKVRFLVFPNYSNKLQNLAEIDGVISNISSKEVQQKQTDSKLSTPL